MTEELKPCPFCGSPAEMYPDGDDEGHQVMCSSGVSSCHMNTFGHQTVDEAVAAWNTRGLTQRPAAPTLKGFTPPTAEWLAERLAISGDFDASAGAPCLKPPGCNGSNCLGCGERPAAQEVGEREACGVMHLIEDYAKAVHDGDDVLCQVLLRTIEASLPAPQQATHEPVGEPDTVPLDALHAAERERDYWKTRARAMLDHAEGTCWYWMGDGEDHLESLVNSLPVVIRADQLRELLARPAPGVPEADPLQGAVDWFWQAIPNLKAHDVANRLSIGCNRAARLLAAAQAKVGA